MWFQNRRAKWRKKEKVGPQSHPYNTYHTPSLGLASTPSLGLAARVHHNVQQQQHAFTDLLLRSYETNMAHGNHMVPAGLPTHPLYSNGATGLPGPVTFSPLGPYQSALMGMTGCTPQPGTFQHLLASMTASVKAKEAVEEQEMRTNKSPCSLSPVSRSNSPLRSDTGSPNQGDQKSSSIAELRHKAREYEFKLQMAQNMKIVF